MRIPLRIIATLVLLLPSTFLAAGLLTAQSLPPSALQDAKWRLIGPSRGGRTLTVVGIPGDRSTYYFGAVAGGVWKTTDSGKSWSPIFDTQSIASIGSIAIAPSDPNVIYVGTGEACIRGDISFGNGVYKSIDAGKTWTHLGLDDTRQIGRVIVDPRNPDIVFVAALGHAHGPNAERGVFRSADGGKTWIKVLYKDDKTGAIDITFDPQNAHVLFAALWQAQRTPWSLVSGGPGSGLYKSTDGGTTWAQITGHGLPEGVLGRIGVTVSGADSSRVYALIEAKDGGLFRSDDGGNTWTRTNGGFDLRGRPWYYTHVFADPRDVDTVFVLTFGMYRSKDGGKTFAHINTPHGDYHDIWIDPEDTNRWIVADDGGATITSDNGKTWTAQDNQPTGQFYRIATDNRFNYYLYGSQQDRGTVAIASRTDHGMITQNDWYDVAGGESGYIAPSPLDPNIVYAVSLYSIFTRYDRRTGQAKNISPWPVSLLNQPADGAKYRIGWTAPMQISPHDPHTIYLGAQMLLKTTDDGQTWSEISPDLTRNDKSKQKSSGGPITQDNTTVEYYDQISTFAESPVQKDLIWVGTDDGLIQLTRDGGKDWTNVTPKQMPEWSMVSIVDPSAHDAGTAYVAVERHRLDDFRPYIYKTSDFGKTWTAITSGMADTDYVHAVREDPKQKGLLFAGTETGVYVSFDDGAHWQSLQLNLPHAPVYDLAVHGDDLAVATHGRAFWILDDLAPLREGRRAVAADAFLVRPAVAYRAYHGFFFGAGSLQGGQNPPNGAIIDYYLKSPPKEAITLEILDAQGKLVRKFESAASAGGAAAQGGGSSAQQGDKLPAKAGMNRFVWDLHYPSPVAPSGGEEEFFFNVAPLALPGEYQIRLKAAEQTLTAPLEIKEDPRVQVSSEDLQKQFDFETRLSARLGQAHEGVTQIKALRKQLDALQQRLKDDPNAKDVVKAAKELDQKTKEAEESITGWKIDPNGYSLNFPPALDDQLAMMMGFGGSQADGAPGQPFFEVLDMLGKKLDAALAQWREINTKDVAALNELMRKANIPAVSVPLPSPEKKSE